MVDVTCLSEQLAMEYDTQLVAGQWTEGKREFLGENNEVYSQFLYFINLKC